jgi:hypothetical protein
MHLAHNSVQMNFTIEWVAFLLRVREVLGSYLGPEIGAHDWGSSCFYLGSLSVSLCILPNFLFTNYRTIPRSVVSGILAATSNNP